LIYRLKNIIKLLKISSIETVLKTRLLIFKTVSILLIVITKIRVVCSEIFIPHVNVFNPSVPFPISYPKDKKKRNNEFPENFPTLNLNDNFKYDVKGEIADSKTFIDEACKNFNQDDFKIFPRTSNSSLYRIPNSLLDHELTERAFKLSKLQ